MHVHQQQSRSPALVPVDVSHQNPLPGKISPDMPFIARAEQSGVHDRRGAERLYDKSGIGILLGGLIEYKSHAGTVTAVPGTVMFGNVDEHFWAARLNDSRIDRLALWYDRTFLDEIADAWELDEPRFPVVGLPPGKTASSFYARVRALASGWADPLETASSLAITGMTLKNESRRNPVVAGRDRQRILSVVSYIEDSFATPCSIDTLALVSGSSRFHFMRQFKAVTGLSPNQYVLNVRLRAAATRITETRASVSEIALDCGFNDISHFNTYFRATFGCTPRQMRGQSREATVPSRKCA